MKKYILILLACASLAQGQTIEIKSLSEVRIDGENAGKVCDVIANHRDLAPAIQRAAEQWQADSDRAREEQISVAEASAAAKVEALDQAREADKAALIAKAAAEVSQIEKELRRQLAEARKDRDFAVKKMKAVVAAAEIQNQEVLEVEIAAAKKARKQAEREEIEQKIEEQIRELEAQKAQVQ